MILVTGATGNLGPHVLDALLGRGERVRVLTRGAGAGLPQQVEVVRGDLRHPLQVADAVAGCDAVVALANGLLAGRRGPKEIDRDANVSLIDAAAAAGVGRFVLLSVHGVRADSPISFYRAKCAAEEHLAASGLPWAVVRSMPFLHLWRRIVAEQVPEGGPALVLGRGLNPIAFAPEEKVAAAVTEALLAQPAPNAIIEVAGDTTYTMTELAEQSGAEKTRKVPLLALRTMRYLAVPINPTFARKAALAVEADTTDMTAPSAV